MELAQKLMTWSPSFNLFRLKKSVMHRLIIISLVWVLSVAVAAGQDAYKAFRGSEHEYNIAKTAFAVSYTWQIFTDLTLVVPAISPVSYTHLRAHETRHDLVCR